MLLVMCVGSCLAQESQTKIFLDHLRRGEERSAAKQWAEAIPLWKKVVQINPVEGEFWNKLGEAYYNNKQFAEAIPAYKQAFELGNGLPWETAYNIAKCYARAGDKEQALRWLEKSFAMGFQSLTQAQADPDFGSVKNEPRFRALTVFEDTSKMSRVEGWRYDLQILSREVKRRRYYPFKDISETEFDRNVKEISAAVPKLTDMQIVVEMMKLMRKVGDGHTMLYAFWERPEFLQTIPVDMLFFREGLFITAADSRYTDLLGAQVLRFGSRTIDETMKEIDPILNRDNERGPRIMGLMRLRELPLMHALGIIPDPDKVSLTIRDMQGKIRTVELPGDSGVATRKLWDGLPPNWKALHDTLPGPLPIYLKNNNRDYRFEFIPETKTVYFQFNHVRDDPQEPFSEFCDRLFKYINEHEVDRLVIDLRWNPGGDTGLTPPLIRALIRSDKINVRGKLFVIIGRRTYSAAQNVATYIERNTNAIFVGEPTNSSPNFIGEDDAFELPYSKIMANASAYYWQSSWPFDYRTWIAPLLYVPPGFEDYRTNRDPAMEAILSYKTGP
ncbi:MAG TPA: tetratricopeptide repeat protein [Pyrinomonadaceae bacterium]|jgi:hypothetical protein|nr:tetratricopeptide repeat protein [Pyrinomonadaceae bacterium]